MPTCGVCENPLAEGANVCDACGTHTGQAPKASATPRQARTAIESALRALGPEEAKGIDVSTAKRLLEAAERAVEGSNFGRAANLGRAARRATLIAHRRSRVEAEIARAEIRLKEARDVGVDTLAFERNLKLARDATAAGALDDAEKILGKASMKALEVRREKRLQSLIDKASSRVVHAKERGGDVERAEEALGKARKASAIGATGEARKHIATAIERADDARKYSRAEAYLLKAQADADAARKIGADLTEARKILGQARHALLKGVYADVQKHVQLAQIAMREAKRFAQAEVPIRNAEREIRKEERRKTDVADAFLRLDAARAALDARDYLRVRALAAEAMELTREAAQLRRLSESLASLSYDSEDLRKIGADATEFDIHAKDAEQAVKAKDLAAAKRFVALARRAAEHAREARYREVVRMTVETIVTRAGDGRVDGVKARELLQEVEDALANGRSVDVSKLIEERLQVRDIEQIKALSTEAARMRESLLELRRADIEVAGAEDRIVAAREATDGGRFKEARQILEEIDEVVHSLQEALRTSSQEMLDRAQAAIDAAAAARLPVPDAVRILMNAQESFAEGKYYEALEFGRIALSRIEKLVERHREELAREQAETKRQVEERTQPLKARIDIARTAVDAIESDFVDVTAGRDALDDAQRALDGDRFGEAEAHIAAAENITKSLLTGMRSSAEGGLDTVRKMIQDAKVQGLPMGDAEDRLARAEKALANDRYAVVLEAVQSIESAIADGRKVRTAEEQRHAVERAKRATERFLRVKSLLDELHRADIDIQGADDILQQAERAIERRDFDEVEGILEGLEETGRVLKAELIAAAKEIIGGARERIDKAKGLGLDIAEASGILVNADAYYEKARYDDAVEFARVAGQKAEGLIAERQEAKVREEADRKDAARTAIEHVRKLVDDLARADIEIVGAKDLVSRAEQELQAGRYDAAHQELAKVTPDVESVGEGLKAAANDLVAIAAQAIKAAKADDFEVTRAENVLANAFDAIKDQRYVEAIEYKKVIEDIIQDARRQRALATLEHRLKDLRTELEANEKLGADVRSIAELLKEAEEDAREGRFDRLETYANRIEGSLATARRKRVLERLAELRTTVERGEAPGLDTSDIDEIERRALAAAEAGDIDTVESLRKEVEDRVIESQRAAQLAKATEEIDALHNLANEAENLGMEIPEVRDLLHQANRAVEQQDFDSLTRLITDARTRLGEARSRHFADRHGARLRGIMATIASARKVGANVLEAEKIVNEAEEALLRNDVETADLLIKEAEVTTGVQVQNFIKNRYPNLTLHLPGNGLQANVWNRYTLEIENKGTLAARNVAIKITGDVEVKGLRPIPEIGVDEKAIVEVGVRPKAEGDVPMEVEVFYQRYFDENRYEAKNVEKVHVDPPGTYLVEDVFLIHADGRLIAHESRKFREQIDEDIFSGMLTVVQDFVKDSFRQRTRVGLKRLDFGDSKILIERSSHTFLACVLLGSEPNLLPLYMIEALKQVEDGYGSVLNRWTGMLHEVAGVEEIIRKLILVTKVTAEEVGALAESPVTEMARSLEIVRQSGADVTEVETLLREATKNLERDLDAAWAFINQAKEKAAIAENRVESRIAELLGSTRGAVEELRGLGADVSQAELLLREADNLLASGKFERVREIAENVRDSLARMKSQVETHKVETELASLVSAIREGRALGVDVREAETYLTRIEEAIQRKDPRRLEEYLRRAFESVDRHRKRMIIEQAGRDIESIAHTIAEAKDLGIDTGDAERYLELAETAITTENTRDLELLVAKARTEARDRVQEQLKDKYPRLFLSIPFTSLEAGSWNRVQVEVANKGNLAAKDLEFVIVGELDVMGLPKVSKIEPNERTVVDVGVRPKASGGTLFDIQLTYRRPLDENRFEVTDSKEIQVEEPGTYPVTDAIAFHRNTLLLAHERREFRDDAARADVERLLDAIRDELPIEGMETGLKRVTVEGVTVLIEPGPNEFLVAVVKGEEPRALPLYLIEVLKQIEDEFGHRLANWNGSMAGLEGLSTVVRKLVFASEAEGADLGPLTESEMSTAVRMADQGSLTGEGGQDFLAWARGLMAEAYGKAVTIVDYVAQAVAMPTMEIARQVREAADAGRASGIIDVTDEQLANYVEIVRRTLEAATVAKARAGIERYWPVKRFAVKAKTQIAYDAIQAFRKLIVAQTYTKELDVVPPNDVWRGMKVQVQIDREAVSAAYKLWARKIEILLKSQDPWKIRAGLAKDEYVVGIDGQRVRIDPKMVMFTEGLPDHVIEEPYQDGIVYLDTELTPDILGEGYAKEIVIIIKDIRKDLKLANEAGIDTRIRASEKSVKLLKSWRDFISRETNSRDVLFADEQIADGYIVEATLGEENFLVSVKAAET